MLSLSAQEQEDAEDELIREMHDRFLQGYDVDWVDYHKIDSGLESDDYFDLIDP